MNGRTRYSASDQGKAGIAGRFERLLFAPPDPVPYVACMLTITRTLRIPEQELMESFIRSSGPGGQNVNKVATAVQLRFDVGRSPFLTEDVRARLLAQEKNRITEDGVLIIEARRYRSQERNRQDARERLVKAIRKALIPPKPRKATRPTRAANLKRLEDKKRRGERKRQRKEPG